MTLNNYIHMALDRLMSTGSRDKSSTKIATFAHEHPFISSTIAAVLGIIFLPVVTSAALVLLVAAVWITIAIIVVGLVTLLPSMVIGTFLWACYVGLQWAHGLIIRGPVGSENKVLVRSEAEVHATGNETYGYLELNMLKVEENREGGDDRESDC